MASRAVLLIVPRLRGWVRPDRTLRWWHPGLWVCASRAVLRYVHVLPRRCPSCNGHGRVVKKRLRRVRCASCQGTGRERKQ
jgi:hypothetical protein